MSIVQQQPAPAHLFQEDIMAERENFVKKAKLAEQAERYEDMPVKFSCNIPIPPKNAGLPAGRLFVSPRTSQRAVLTLPVPPCLLLSSTG